MQTIVILGTGTDVGKTYATERIATALADQLADVAVSAIKPIETGVVPGALTDAARLGAVSRPKLEPSHAFSFVPPISPHLASRKAGAPIRIEAVVRWVKSRKAEQQPGGWLLVETAGGVFSPVNDTETNLDLALALDPACWVLIAADCLGVLHNVRSTLLAMERLGRPPDIILLNATQTADNSTGTNRAELERLGWATITGTIERSGGFCDVDRQSLLDALNHFSESNLWR
jgi:dethiobiotin synthetase